MGRKNKAYYKDLHQQAYERLHGMLSFGESKKEAVANGTNQEKIFSFRRTLGEKTLTVICNFSGSERFLSRSIS